MVSSSKPISIRRFRPADQQGVYALITTVLHQEYALDGTCGRFPEMDLENIRTSYGGRRDVFFVAVQDGVPVGTVAIKEDDHNTALLRRLVVAKPLRGSGIGSRLLIKAIQFCEKSEYRVINFYSTDRMIAAISLCTKNGFRRRTAMQLSDCVLLRFCRSMRQQYRKKQDLGPDFSQCRQPFIPRSPA